ncbi:beta strand repeat-containing protein [Pseudomonas lini]
MAITTGTVTLDETTGKQNNDFGVGELSGIAVPAPLTSILEDALNEGGTEQVLDPATTTVALSGSTLADPDGTEILDFTGLGTTPITDVKFSQDTDGDPFDGSITAKYRGADLLEHDLLTSDGYKIYLYSSGISNDAVIGRKATAGGLTDPDGDVVFVAYLDTNTITGVPATEELDAGATGAKVYLVEFEPLQHPDTTNPDDAVTISNLYVTVDQFSHFSIEGAPSGQNLFLMFGDGTPGVDDNGDPANEVSIVVTATNPVNQSGPNQDPLVTGDDLSITTGGTISTSQGGGGTTIGHTNQMVDPGEALAFTFVTNVGTENNDVIVPNLNENEADVETNIKFTGLHTTTGATFTVVQLQQDKAATLTISASLADFAPAGAYIDELKLFDDGFVNINYVKVSLQKQVGNDIVPVIDPGDPNDPNDDTPVFTEFDPADSGIPDPVTGVTVTFNANGTVTLAGVQALDVIEYHTGDANGDLFHSRVVIANSAVNPGNQSHIDAAFDIGQFALRSSVSLTESFAGLVLEDDGPTATGGPVTATVDEDSLVGGIDGGTGDVGLLVPATASGTIASIFQSGVDTPATYGLSNDTSGVQVFNTTPAAVTLTSKGETVKYDVIGNTLWAFVGTGSEYVVATDRAVFKLELTNPTVDGSYTFTLLDQLDHPDTVGGDNTENDLLLHLGSVLKITDKDGDSVTAAANSLVITVDDDTPIATVNQLTGTVDEDGVLEGAANAGPGDGIAGGTDDVSGQAVVASGNVSTLFQSGADEPLTYTLTTNGLTALGLKSAGVTVTYAVAYDAGTNTHTLTASAPAGNTVFTFSVHAATGAYTFTLVDQLDHATLDGLAGDNTENDLSIALDTAINATDADGDTVTAAANGLVITVDDDTPIATVNQLTGTVDEDGVLEGTANAGPGDGIAGGTDDVSGQAVVASGNVSTLFQSGADEALTYSLTTNGLTALGLQSAGVTVTYAVAYDAGTNTHTLTASAPAGNTVFTFSVHAATGAYTFTLVDQLDHASLDGLAGDNTENDLSIALGTAINATDFDGDAVTAAANGLVITVDDDTPIATLATLTGTVDEDGVLEGAANAGPGDGIAGGPGDVSGQAVVASGTVSTLFQSGADEALTYSLTTNGLTALGLQSAGVTVTYAVAYDAGTNTHTLTASAPAGNTVFTFSVHAATGAYTFTLVDQLDHASLDGLTGDNTENDLSIALGTAINATDFDGDTVTAAANGLVITVDDDTPIATVATLTGTVDEDGVREGASDNGPGDGIAGGAGDVAGEVVEASGTVSTLFQTGADEALTYSLTTNGLTALGLKSAGATVTYAVAYDAGTNTHTLTASTPAGNTVFTFSVHAATGAYLFTLVDQLDHASLDGLAGDNTENDLSIALGTAINATDFDGDTVTAAANGLVITVDDDSPVVTAKSNLVYANSSNPTPGGTGVFAYDIGADQRLAYSDANSDLSVSLTGVSVGANAITNKAVTWSSETDTTAVFNIAFTYVSNNPNQGDLTNATGTLTFNKVADTYTLSLTDEIESFSILRTSTAKGFTGYAIDGITPINQQPPVSVATLADDFFVQFTGFAEAQGGTGANNIKAGGDNAFINDSPDGNELFSAATSWVSVSGTAAGVAGDTIQQGEVMDLDFFTANPFGDTSATPTATSKGVFVKFDGIGSEDLVLVLKLIDPDDQSQITRAIIVDSQDIILKTPSTSPNNFHPIANPAAYGIVLDQNDGAVIIESNDYNFGTENYLIEGLQVLVSTEGVTGSGYNLNGNVGVTGASTGASLIFGDEDGEGGKSNPLETGEAASWDGDVVKIVDMGFVTSATPDARLTFDVVVTDADGDSTGTQTLDVSIAGGKTFTGGANVDTFSFIGLDTDTDVVLSAVTTVISGGFASGVDKLDFTAAGSGTNYTEVLAPVANLAAFTAAADTALDGTTDYYFGVVGGDGYLAFDGDGSGITNIIQLVGVTDIAFTDIV